MTTNAPRSSILDYDSVHSLFADFKMLVPQGRKGYLPRAWRLVMPKLVECPLLRLSGVMLASDGIEVAVRLHDSLFIGLASNWRSQAEPASHRLVLRPRAERSLSDTVNEADVARILAYLSSSPTPTLTEPLAHQV